MSDGPTKEKSYKLAIRIVNLYKHLTDEKHEFVMSKEVLRAGTSIGAYVSEAEQAVSRADFIHQMALALRYSARTVFWLELLRDTGYLTQAAFDSLYADCEDVIRLLTKIVKTSRQTSE